MRQNAFYTIIFLPIAAFLSFIQAQVEDEICCISTSSLIFATVLLLIVSVFLFCLWLGAVRKNAKNRAILLQKKQDEQAFRALLELKKKALEHKNRAFEQLSKEKEALEQQTEAYRQKIDEYELTYEDIHDYAKGENSLNHLLLKDIARLINKRLPKKKEYIELLDRIDEKYISTLKNLYDGNLTIPHIRYCICFSIGMEIGEVAECFSIELSSVHMVRYRLKKKFGLDNSDDLDAYLRNLNTNANP